MEGIPTIALIIFLMISLIVCVISSLFNAYIFSMIYFFKGKRNVYGRGYVFYLCNYAVFLSVVAYLFFIPYFQKHSILPLLISSVVTIVFGAFWLKKISDKISSDTGFELVLLSILFFVFGIPGFLGGVYIISIPLGPILLPFIAPIR